VSGDAFWREPAEHLFSRLGTTPAGLSAEEAAARLARDGANESVTGQKRRGLIALVRRLTNPLVAVLLLAAAVAGATGDRASFAIIVLVVLLSTVMDLVQERRAEATVAALRHSIALRATVCRDGQYVDLPVREIVGGDVIRLCAGDLVPADGIVIEANATQVNEALLTGEPYPMAKRVGLPEDDELPHAFNALFQGTSLIGGTATMVVVATGRTTRFGAIALSLASIAAASAFELGVRRFGVLILRLTLFLVLFVLLAHLMLGRPPLQSFLFAMALAVGLTPELLPMIMTVALARGAERLAKAKVVVKRLSAIHDLGQMDVLCTDKTGTLTEAKIDLVGHIGIDGNDDDRVLELAAVNARFETGLKSPLDQALLDHSTALTLDPWIKIDEKPFDFERRRVSVLAERGSERVEIVKGAPETILALCDRVQMRDGSIVPRDADLATRLRRLHDERAEQGLRLLAVATKEAGGQDKIGDGSENGLVFVGYCVFVDPPKGSATATIAALERAKVAVKVISGDAPAVVEHLVATLALPVSGLLTGDQIARLSDVALAARVGKIDLYARVTPDQKVRIVKALQARGHTVGFLGDGINDAPAIRAADVGLSVEGATDVAREAADMILLASDLGVIANGVAEGRRTYANIVKYLRMGTSSNFGNMLTMAIASLWLPFLPLTPVQVLLNNLFYDLSQVGLPFDRADRADLAAPHGWDMHALLRFTAIMGPLSSAFDLATFAVLLGWWHVDVAAFRGAWFIESMATQILVLFVIRTRGHAWSSAPHPALTTSALIGLGAAIALPILPSGASLGFAIPPMPVIGAIAVLVLAYLAMAELLKRAI